MKKAHIRIVGGWCGNRMAMIQEYLGSLLPARGYSARVDFQSIWESQAVCPTADLILQLIPAFSKDEVHCPLLDIRPMLRDLEHAQTVELILNAVAALDFTPGLQMAGNTVPAVPVE